MKLLFIINVSAQGEEDEDGIRERNKRIKNFHYSYKTVTSNGYAHPLYMLAIYTTIMPHSQKC